MTIAYIAIRVPKDVTYSEATVIQLIKHLKDNFEKRSHQLFYQGENTAQQHTFDENTEKLLIVQVEETFIPNPSNPTDPNKAWTHIGALYQFCFIENHEGQKKSTSINHWQQFSPKYHKLGLLKAYIDNQTPKNLENFLNVTTPKELHGLVKTLTNEMIEEDKIKPDSLLDAVKKIEEVFVKQQETKDFWWTVGAVLTFSILHWIRKAFFPDSFNGFVKHVFKKNEAEQIREGMKRFWAEQNYDLTNKLNSDLKEKDLSQFDQEKFGKKFTASKRKQVTFNKHHELKTFLNFNVTTRGYELIGTKQQVDRWLFFQNYGKELLNNDEEFLKSAPPTKQKTKDHPESFGPFFVENSGRVDPLITKETALTENMKISLTESTQKSKSLVEEGKDLADPFYEKNSM